MRRHPSWDFLVESPPPQRVHVSYHHPVSQYLPHYHLVTLLILAAFYYWNPPFAKKEIKCEIQPSAPSHVGSGTPKDTFRQPYYLARRVHSYENVLRWKHFKAPFAHINLQVQGHLMVLCWEVEGSNSNEITDVRDYLGKSCITSVLLIFLNLSNWALT